MKNYNTMNSKLLIITIVLLFSSCSRKHINTIYQAETKNTGTVIIKPVKKTKKTYVTIDGKLLVDSRKVKSVTIRNVPIGDHVVQFSSDNSWYKYSMDSTYKITVDSASTVTKIVKTPPYSNGYYIYQGAVFLGSVIFLLFL